MHLSTGARTLAAAITSVLLLGAFGTAASADVPETTITLGKGGTLTLPASDNVRDTITINATTDATTRATAYVRQAGTEESVFDLASLYLAEPGVEYAITVPTLDTYEPGTYELVVTPEVGSPSVTEFTVGSGKPSSVALALSAPTIYSWTKKSPNTSTATVTATDETGLKVAFTGSVKATVGGTTVSLPLTAKGNPATGTVGSAKAVIKASALKAGTGTVKATVKGAGSSQVSSAGSTLKVVHTSVTGVKLTASATSVFPVKDGYRDSVKLTVTPTSSVSGSVPATGTVKITHGGKTVTSWKLTSTAKRTFTWGGRNNGSIKPGTYVVTVSIKGPEGTTKTASKSLTVSSKKLVTKTATRQYKASAIMKKYMALDYYEDGACYRDWDVTGDVFCEAYDAYNYDPLALISQGKIPVPADVVSAQKFGGATVKLTTTWGYVSGDTLWTYDTKELGTAKSAMAKKGTQTLGALKLPETSRTVHVTYGLGEYASAQAKTIKAVYTYKTLQ